MDSVERVQNDDITSRCKLKKHIAFRGFVVLESDSVGPVLVLVRGGDCLETWKRESKSDGDFNMRFVGRQKMLYAWNEEEKASRPPRSK